MQLQHNFFIVAILCRLHSPHEGVVFCVFVYFMVSSLDRWVCQFFFDCIPLFRKIKRYNFLPQNTKGFFSVLYFIKRGRVSSLGCTPVMGENRQLVTNELVEFEK